MLRARARASADDAAPGERCLVTKLLPLIAIAALFFGGLKMGRALKTPPADGQKDGEREGENLPQRTP